MQDDDVVCNRSNNETFDEVLQQRYSRRQVLRGGLGAAAVSMFGGLGLTGCNDSNGGSTSTSSSVSTAEPTTPPLGFRAISTSLDDTVYVPEGYTGKVLYAWGDPISNGPAFSMDAQNSAAEQAQQAGMHHDGIHYFSLPDHNATNSSNGLLVMNHEYVDEALIHIDGGYVVSPATYSLEKANKEIAAHGVSIIEVRKNGADWSVVRPSSYARRITGATPMTLKGPVAGSVFARTPEDPTGTEVLGTLNNCANGYTPWGTYLTCEENFHQYFGATSGNVSDNDLNAYDRYGIDANSSYGWETQLDRFNLDRSPNEPNRFGWIIEIDPYDPNSKPVKHTALGRFSHENAAYLINADKRLAIYSGDDARFEYIYKFVTAKAYDPNNRSANMGLLDEGTLYVAKFNADGTGDWIALAHGQNGLTAANGFRDQAEVLVKTRLAADFVGATPMDRPEWFASDHANQQMYGTLTNNSRRAEGREDAANPRPDNRMGHIIRWKDMNGDITSTRFTWEIYALAGSPTLENPLYQGNINGDVYSSPDGLWIDYNGILWIQTDISSSSVGNGVFEPFGNNQMLASDPATGETRRFLTGPKGCEVTGMIATPDMKTLFVNIQHPGESSATTPANPKGSSSWPDGPDGGRPRSATVVITKDDGGVIGT